MVTGHGYQRDLEELLKGICTFDPDACVYRDVFSPARAKGLEYDTVILYKFGASAPPRVPPTARRRPTSRRATG